MSTEPALPATTLPEDDIGTFYIATTAMAARPRRTLKHGDTFAVLDSFGDIGASVGGAEGLFHDDTRFLSQLVLLLNGRPPLLLGSNLRDDNALLSVDLSNPDFLVDGRIVLQKDLLHIGRTTFLWRSSAYQRLAVRNHGDRPLNLVLSIHFSNDFADLFEVRGLARARRGTPHHRVDSNAHVTLGYRGLDERERTTSLVFDPPPSELAVDRAAWRLQLAPGQTRPLFLAVGCDTPPEQRPAPFLRGLLAARRELRAAARDTTTVETSNDIFNEVLCRSAADLQMLTTETPQGRYPYAGIPWYSTTFGRDGLITALQMLWCDPSVAKGVLRRLAAYQARTSDAKADAQPGKILHEMRSGEMAALNEVPFGLYYGSVDATPLFVLLAGRYLERTDDVGLITELWPAMEMALGWIDGPGDPDGDGFVEYRRATAEGLANQGWKDSYDAIFHTDGRLAEGNIALAEVQGYVFAAKNAAAKCARRLGHYERARRLEYEATTLGQRFNNAFWCADIGTYALALDGAKRPCRVRTSNAGQLLFTGIVPDERASAIATQLLGPSFFSGWGIRTVASTEARYNPMSYHNGSVWPHDNALIALGFGRCGLKLETDRLFRGLFDAATYMDLRRLPELFCGFQRQRSRGPTLYPVACSPQAWASATPFSLIEAALGLEFHPEGGEIRLRNPRLPSFLDEVTLRRLSVGGANLDVTVRRHNGDVSLEILRTDGKVQISVISSR
jgi:glycogen debranching enzyme